MLGENVFRETFIGQIKMSGGSPPQYHLAHFPVLFVRFGDDIREAPEADQLVARSYPNWPDKGMILHSRRITILTASRHVRPHEAIRVIHVLDRMRPSGA